METNEAIPLEKYTPEQRDTWRKTGQEPEVKEEVAAKVAEPAAKEVEEIKHEPDAQETENVTVEAGEEGESGTPTKTEGAEKAGQVKKPGQMGYKDLRARIAELEQQIAKGAKPAAADNEAVKADAKTKDAERKRPRSTDKNEDGTPKYKDWDAYEDDFAKFQREELRAEMAKESTKTQQDQKVEALNKEIQQVLKSRADEARKKYTDFDKVALADDLPIIKDGVLDRWILDSEQGMDIAYHYGSHRDELEKLNAMSPFAAARELTRLEDKLSSSASGKSDVVVVAPPPKVTKAPPPAREVGGRGSHTGDPEDTAVAQGDFKAFSRAANEKHRIVVVARK